MVIRNLYVKYSLSYIKLFYLLYWKPYRAIFIKSMVLLPFISMPTHSPRRALINLSPLYDTFWITLEIINTRMNYSLPTIISTNLSLKELEERYTRRISSRIIGEYAVLDFFGKDIRQIKSEQE